MTGTATSSASSARMAAAAKQAAAMTLVMASSFSSCLASATSRLTRRLRSWTTSAARSPDLTAPFDFRASAFVAISAAMKATPGGSDLPADAHLWRKFGRQLRGLAGNEAELRRRAQHHHPPPQRHAGPSCERRGHRVQVGISHARRLGEGGFVRRVKVSLALGEAEQLAAAPSRHARRHVVRLCTGAADRGLIQHVEGRRILDEVPVAVSVVESIRGRRHETRRPARGQLGMKSSQRLLIRLHVATGCRPVREDVREQLFCLRSLARLDIRLESFHVVADSLGVLAREQSARKTQETCELELHLVHHVRAILAFCIGVRPVALEWALDEPARTLLRPGEDVLLYLDRLFDAARQVEVIAITSADSRRSGIELLDLLEVRRPSRRVDDVFLHDRPHALGRGLDDHALADLAHARMSKA